MYEVTLGGPGLEGFPQGQQGGYVKLMLPSVTPAAKQVVRTYTIRAQREGEIDVQFALHGGNAAGPATQWALDAKVGDALQVGGPGPAKPVPSGCDFTLIGGDMSALPAIEANLEVMQRDAKGVAVIEIQHPDDEVALQKPDGVEIVWLVNPEPGTKPQLLADALRSIDLPLGTIGAWFAAEFSAMRAARQYLREELGLGPDRLYISSYWKHGLDEAAHKLVKRDDAMAEAA